MSGDGVDLSSQEREQVLTTMGEQDIIRYLSGNKLFGGVFANDELKKPDPKKIYILNLQNSDESGSHWTLLYAGNYFDSYAVAPTKAISRFVKRYNTQSYQGLSKASCGYYCLYVADNITAGREPYLGMKPDQPQWNEDILKKYFY
jgi:hypothetical protein